MKTQNTNLVFKKDSMLELNEDSMNSIAGGSNWAVCPFCLVDLIAAALE